VKPGLTINYLSDGRRRGRLESVTAKAGTREGQPVTFAALDQTESWIVRNGGVKLAATIRRNVAKMNGRTWETPNAFRPGEESVAERTQRAAAGGAPGIYYHSVEAPPFDPKTATDEEVAAALRVAYGDAWWTDIPRFVAEFRDPDTAQEDAERFYCNWDRTGGTKAVDPKRWDALGPPALEVRVVAEQERVGLGFDGSLTRDATALIACTADFRVFVPTVGGVPTIWERPLNAPADWRIPRLAVDAAVAAMFERYDVGRMFCDPPRWATEIERWAELYGDTVVLMLDTNQPKRMAAACDRWDSLVGRAGDPVRLTHDGNLTLRSHVLAMVRRRAYVKDDRAEAEGGPAAAEDLRTRYVFDKGPEGHKIDAGIASVAAVEAAATMPAPAPRVPAPNIF
jgi:hypothetical protein